MRIIWHSAIINIPCFLFICLFVPIGPFFLLVIPAKRKTWEGNRMDLEPLEGDGRDESDAGGWVQFWFLAAYQAVLGS